jgi:hypothetical protein
VTAADDKRAAALAELARQFFLWLREHELPGWSGSKGLEPADFVMFAGAYRRLVFGSVVDFYSDPAEQRRVRSVGVGATHVLLVGSPDESTWIPSSSPVKQGRLIVQNELFFPGDGEGDGDIEQPGALAVAAPILDSSVADVDTLATWRYHTFAGLTPRVDLAWDDSEEAARVELDKRYRWVFDYETPRREYARNVRDIVPIDSHVSLEAFRHDLYWSATYTNRRRVSEEGGDYYSKWKRAAPKRKEDRDYRPTKLSADYLRESFHEYVLKRDETYLLVELPGRYLLYLVTPVAARGGRAPTLHVRFVMRYQNHGAPPTDEPRPPGTLAVIFYAYDGGKALAPVKGPRGVAELGGGASGRYAYDFKAVVRSFLRNKHLAPGDDAAWFTLFERSMFPDAVYGVDGRLPGAATCTLTIDQLVQLGDEATGIIKDRLDELVVVARRQPDLRFVVKGWYYGGTAASRRQLIGVSAGHVYEWYPLTRLVTRMALADWCRDNELLSLAGSVYEGSRGVIPFITLVTWGGALVAGGAVLGGGGVLANLVRVLIREASKEGVGRRVTKELIRKYRAQLTALLVDGLLLLFPRTDNLYFELLRGFVHGFGAGAIEYYLSHVDDRLEKEVQRLYHIALNKLTGGVDRAYRLYLKVSAAIQKLAAVFHTLRAVWTPAFALAAAAGLIVLGRSLGIALIICLVVVFYVDYIYRSGKIDQAKRDVWARHQRAVFKLMIKETGADLAAHADALREDLAGPPRSADEVRARNDRMAASIVAAVMKAPTEAPGVMDMLQEILAEIGIDNWKELSELGFLEVLGRGWDAFARANPHLAAEKAHVLGLALGELIGTFFLQRAMLPERWRKGPIVGSRPIDKSIRKVVAGGTVGALWKFAKAPIDELMKSVSSALSGIREASTEHGDLFERVQHDDTRYRDFLQDLIKDERDLASSLGTLAVDASLPDRLRAIAARASTELPPDIEDVRAGEVAGWPRDALLFALQTWLDVGLLHILRAFDVLEDDAPFDGKFRLATLLEIAGLDVSLDDETARAVAATFERV